MDERQTVGSLRDGETEDAAIAAGDYRGAEAFRRRSEEEKEDGRDVEGEAEDAAGEELGRRALEVVDLRVGLAEELAALEGQAEAIEFALDRLVALAGRVAVLEAGIADEAEARRAE